MSNKIKLGSVGVKGLIHARVVRDGVIRQEVKTRNIFTDGGIANNPNLNHIFGSGFFSNPGFSQTGNVKVLGVGSSSAPAKFSDTSIGSLIAANLVIGGQADNSGASGYIRTITFSTVFQPGVATGNIREVTLSPGYNTPTVSNVSTRALIKDEHGDPVTIVVEPEDALMIDYIITVQQDMSSGSGSFTLTGNKGGLFTYDIEPLISAISGNLSGGSAQSYMTTVKLAAADGAFSNLDASEMTYSALNGVGKITAKLPTNKYNFNGGIKRIRIDSGDANFIGYELTLDNAIPKTNKDILTLEFEIDFNQAEDPDE